MMKFFRWRRRVMKSTHPYIKVCLYVYLVQVTYWKNRALRSEDEFIREAQDDLYEPITSQWRRLPLSFRAYTEGVFACLMGDSNGLVRAVERIDDDRMLTEERVRANLERAA